MIGPEHVDQQVETALHLVVVIGDIGREIGPAAIGFLDRTIDIVAMFGRTEQGLLARLPVFGRLALGRLEHAFIDQALVLERLQRLFDQAGAIERFFRIEHVHLDAKRLQVIANELHHRFGGKVAHLGQPNRFGLVDIGVADLFHQGLADGDQVVARIGAVLEGDGLPVRFEVAQVDRARQHIDLRAAVIDVVFPA